MGTKNRKTQILNRQRHTDSLALVYDGRAYVLRPVEIVKIDIDLNGLTLPLQWHSMKLTLAIVVYVLIGLFIGAGIFAMTNGSYWLLIVAVLSYLLGFAAIGCSEH